MSRMVSDSNSYTFMSQQEVPPSSAITPSWDFSLDLLAGLEQLDDTSTSLEGSPSPGLDAPVDQLRSEAQAGPSSGVAQTERASRPSRGVRKQSQNRQAQHRFRQRQKARTENVMAQLTATTTQVQEMQNRQQQLEARNTSLESFASTSLSHDPLGPPAADADWSQVTSTMAGDAQQRIALTVLPNQFLIKTVQELGRMPFTEFTSLYSAYAQKINQCLVQMSQTGESIPTMAALHTWARELSCMKVALAMGNLRSSVAYTSFRLDGRIGAGREQLPSSFYQNLLAALRLTSAQRADMLLMRKLFHAKRGVLMREREQLWSRVPEEVPNTAADAASKMIATTTIAQRLQESSAAEFRATLQFGSAFERGTLTLAQQALYVVNSFPYIPDTMRTCETLAATVNGASVDSLVHPAGVDEFEHSVNWQQILNYLTSITQANVHLHVPLIGTP